MRYMPNVWKLFAIRFFSSLIPAYVIERLYWEERGMTIEMVVYTEIIYAVTIVLLELPTGIMADKWGRKPMIVLSAFMGCCEFLILLFATEFWHFALVVFLAAIGRSASSGAENALLYDSLLSAGEETSFEKYLGHLNALDISATIIAALCGSLLASRFHYELNYGISFVSTLVSLGLTLTLVEPAVKNPTDEDPPIPIRTYITASVRFFRNHPGVYLVLLSGMVTGSAVNFIDEFWQTYLDRVHIPVLYFGLVSAAIFMLRLPGNLVAHKLKSVFGYSSLLSAIMAGIALGFLCLSVMKGISGLAAILLVCLMAGVMEPLAAGYLQHRIDSSMRATLGSFQSLGENAVLSVIGIGFGYFSSKLDIFGGFGFIACICCLFLIYFSYASRKHI
ncbi:MFS transporter [Cohnella pontilimi]|uniref:MFS transporter n=1 Tax=Cohnella pontilimi TaxID=2564100 RepID=A0A4U0FB31_9BACL|nr:MFS transporter [Cohnella pontilimi]TJY41778.1 MFS transporter [Cohnella pontilimi]